MYGIGIVSLKVLFQSFLDISAVTFVLYMMHRIIMEVLSEKTKYGILKTNTSIEIVKGS